MSERAYINRETIVGAEPEQSAEDIEKTRASRERMMFYFAVGGFAMSLIQFLSWSTSPGGRRR
jgi:hypothetical protein